MTNKGRKYYECRDYFNVTKKTTNGKTVVIVSCKYCGEETVLNASRLPDHLLRCKDFPTGLKDVLNAKYGRGNPNSTLQNKPKTPTSTKNLPVFEEKEKADVLLTQ
uniref:Uncharacterized protein n=1 Tax=Acrobeloides nanus TaxID=290746 RepID=A0A914ENY8_9BILA